MVSSGTVKGDESSLTSCFSKYTSTVGDLGSNWQGPSSESLQGKFNEFASSFSSTIQSEMDAFATACDLYEQYKSTKAEISNAEAAVNNGTGSSADVSSLRAKLSELKSQIESSLSKASSVKLDATAISAAASSGNASSDAAATTTTAATSNVNWADDKNFVYYNQGGGWNNYKYSNGGGSNTMANSGCGPTSMAMVLSSMGYKINPNVAADWASSHNYHYDGTSEGYFRAYASSLGVNSKALGKSSDNIRNALSNNELVILHVGPGSLRFTSGGHYMVARAYDAKTNKVLIADPNKKSNNKWFDLNEVVQQLKGSEYSWSFSAGNNDTAKV
jgi:hypothetical protein